MTRNPRVTYVGTIAQDDSTGLTCEQLRELLLGPPGSQRFTQDSPIFADVWQAYLGEPGKPQDVLLEPLYRVPVGVLANTIRGRLQLTKEHELAYAGEYVAVKVTLVELLRSVLTLAPWWHNLAVEPKGRVFDHLREYALGGPLDPDPPENPIEVPPPEADLLWLIRVAGRLLTNRSTKDEQDDRELAAALLDALGDPPDDVETEPQLWSVSRNRPVQTTLWKSRETVKADAASRVFPPNPEWLAWAVIDSGIDARHPAFLKRKPDGTPVDHDGTDPGDDTCIVETYDFTQLRAQIADAIANPPARTAGPQPTREQALATVSENLAKGLAIDWQVYAPLIRVDHGEAYRSPKHPHGTHVAGTIAGDWRTADPEPSPRHPLQGVCPGLKLYDLRVLGDDGRGDEFSVLAALSFVRWRNTLSGGTVIHGVNLSVALFHDVLNSACGRSPVCLEAERVHNAGVVVVAAAGNDGRADYSYQGRASEGYRTASIADPGNTEVAITVGSTHRIEPHAYGVSYFSSRGPTGDGRAKPDIVAPGEKITAPVPGPDAARMDGTSMAAPHVSGAAALLMARHRELVGRPTRIKQVLCESATDLGRERHYQGHGMLDILRALQAV